MIFIGFYCDSVFLYAGFYFAGYTLWIALVSSQILQSNHFLTEHGHLWGFGVSSSSFWSTSSSWSQIVQANHLLTTRGHLWDLGFSSSMTSMK